MKKIILAIVMMAFLFIESGGSATPFIATAYCLRGKTASGHKVARGIAAADPHILPLGTTIQLEGGTYSGVYTVRDTGGNIKGKRLDLWVPTHNEARKFGQRLVKVTILVKGTKAKSL